MKPLEYRPTDWKLVWERIVSEHGASINISYVCRRKLGFTVRHHAAWIEQKHDLSNSELEIFGRGYYKDIIYLDFYDESMRTLFLLKYS